ncbi:WXG100 family type VII secretion target [Amycolatopsis sp. GM8]|uniref:WXG100 family type VII secretion target n=1 Tax=Amycolatopsis sp. GM8 TaxID=2896530 RepID=UPI001F30F882|nr:WXG100 family type VII secretion target [Amycolatopsis sp. GM8]
MADEKVTGQASGISITKQGDPGFINTSKVGGALPGPLGSGYSAFSTVKGALSDGKVSTGEIAGIAASGASFVSSCMSVSSIATDPIGWLVGQGLNFLMTVVQPLQDAIHFVSGDGPALANAAGNFGSIAQGLVQYSQKFAQEAQTSLTQWSGKAAETAGKKLAEFSHGIEGIAGQAGDIAQLLQISSMVMQVIEEFIKAILTELITWLIMIWIPALAAAVPTCGGSTAAAGTATTVRGAQTGSKVSRYIQKLKELLDKIKQFLQKMKDFFTQWKGNFKDIMKLNKDLGKLEAGPLAGNMGKLAGSKGMVGSRAAKGFGQSMKDTAEKTAWGTVGLGGGKRNEAGEWEVPLSNAKEGYQLGAAVAGKVNTYYQGGEKAATYGETGEEQTTEETSDELDF